MKNIHRRLVQAIQSLGRQYNTGRVPRVPIKNFPRIDKMYEQSFEGKPFIFSKVFKNKNEYTFDPQDLKFTGSFKIYLETTDEGYPALYKIISITGDEYLISITPERAIGDFWLIDKTKEEPQEEAPAEGEDEEEGEDEGF